MVPKTFTGNASDLQWLRKLDLELVKGAIPEEATRTDLPSRSKSHLPPLLPETAYKDFAGEKVDPFVLPDKLIADYLIASFFRTIHVSFPVLDKTAFLFHYKMLTNTWHAETFEDCTFLAELQLVFAIGAIHTQISGSKGILDEKDHLLFAARAHILSLDSGVFGETSHLAQVQMFGLSALYSFINECLDR